MTRIQKLFSEKGDRRALVTFITAGDPTLAHTVPALHRMADAGADIIELGIPFSDPEAEGPAIQASHERALAKGMTLVKTLDMVREFRKHNASTPIILMGYLNPVLAMSDFPARAQAAGVDGLIMVNLPPEEAEQFQSELAEHQIDLIFLIAPTTTDERVKLILDQATGFAYYVSLKGTTGAGNLQVDEVARRLGQLKAVSDVPVCVGFGIKDAATAKAVAVHADGAVVGSVLVNLMSEYSDDIDACIAHLGAAVEDLRAGLDEL
jgi:tryptophan synthase alpha chain